jgi:hypothetical protein
MVLLTFHALGRCSAVCVYVLHGTELFSAYGFAVGGNSAHALTVLLACLVLAQTYIVGPQAAVQCGGTDAKAAAAAATVGAVDAGSYDSDRQRLKPVSEEGGKPASPRRPVAWRKPRTTPRTPARSDYSYQRMADWQRLRMQLTPVQGR